MAYTRRLALTRATSTSAITAVHIPVFTSSSMRMTTS